MLGENFPGRSSGALSSHLALLACLLGSPMGTAKTVEPAYEDPFDVAGGGAVLTRATQEGMLVSNPAQLPYGGKFLRWMGGKFTVMPGLASVDLARQIANNSNAAASAGQASNTDEFVDGLFTKPIHLGAATSLSVLTNNGGIAVFARAEPDLRAWRKGDPDGGAGTPNIVVRSELAAGAYASVASRSLWDWLALGLSLKYLMVSDAITRVDITDQEAVRAFQTELLSQQTKSLSGSVGADASMLIFLQSAHVDLRLAGTLNDIGGLARPQTLHAGLGLTFHSEADALHLSADLRDIEDAYQEPLYKRVYVGAKLLVRGYVGVAVGVYHGNPSYGAELDLIVLRLTGTVYTREYARSPGVDRRSIGLLSIASGLNF